MNNVKPNESIFESMGNDSIFESGGIKDEQSYTSSAENENSQPNAFEASLSPAEYDIYHSMTDHEHAQLKTMAKGINIADASFIGNYGTNVMAKVEQASVDALNLTRIRDLGEVGSLMNGFIMQLKSATPGSKKKHGAFFRVTTYLEQLNLNFQKTGDTIEKAKKMLDTQKNQLVADNVQYDHMYTQVLDNYRLLNMYIISGKIKLAEARKELAEKQAQAAKTADQADIEAAASFEDQIRNFDNLLNELAGSKVLCLQTAPAIRTAKQNNSALIQKFHVLRFTAIPAWYTQIQLLINQENTRNAAIAANAATDFTNKLILENAKALKQNAVMAAQLAESEVIRTDTLEEAQTLLIETWDEVTAIHEEGQQLRNQNQERKAELEANFKDELIKRMRNPQ